jgi:hypothetical protein
MVPEGSVKAELEEMHMSVIDAECGRYDLRSAPRSVKRCTRPLWVPTACQFERICNVNKQVEHA